MFGITIVWQGLTKNLRVTLSRCSDEGYILHKIIEQRVEVGLAGVRKIFEYSPVDFPACLRCHLMWAGRDKLLLPLSLQENLLSLTGKICCLYIE